jgi:hypothetical protein
MFGMPPITFVEGAVIAHAGQLHDTLRVRRGVVDGVGVRPRRGNVVVARWIPRRVASMRIGEPGFELVA